MVNEEENRQTPVEGELETALQIEQVYQLWWNWADFSLYVVTPTIEPISPPFIHEPEKLHGSEDVEFVYPIHDYGYKLSTSKGEDMLTAGKSNCKLFYTIEKMIYLLIERLKAGGIDVDEEVQVAFSGFELGQRKAFESVINLKENVVVTNFDPGEWGNQYLDIVKRMVEKGYGHPNEAPRTQWKQSPGASVGMKR